MTVYYKGSGQYCYANSLAMALSKEEEYDPGYLECLTGVAISAFLTEDGLPFFSSKFNAPDKGINYALDHLGYNYTHYFSKIPDRFEGDKAFQELELLMENGPVIVGPVDMGKLVYIPNHAYLGGVDHYIVVHCVDRNNVFIHDPAGYPYMSLTRDEFMRAWKAESIEYKMGSYSIWGNFERIGPPSYKEQFLKADKQIKDNLLVEKSANVENVGPKSILKIAEIISKGNLSDSLKGHLSFFSLQLGARRCSDFSAFYKPFDKERCLIKDLQGLHFGSAHVALMRKNWKQVWEDLRMIADLEEQFQEKCMQVSV